MLQFSTTMYKFEKKGEKTGWTYIEISAAQAKKLKPGYKVSFRVRGTLDKYPIEKMALLPMGEGNFILPLKAPIRKALGKKHGDKLAVCLEADDRKLTMSRDLLLCLKDDPEAMAFFKTLPPSHQMYFSKWIEAAKTSQTKTRRIVTAVAAFRNKQGYGEMMRAYKDQSIA